MTRCTGRRVYFAPPRSGSMQDLMHWVAGTMPHGWPSAPQFSGRGRERTSRRRSHRTNRGRSRVRFASSLQTEARSRPLSLGPEFPWPYPRPIACRFPARGAGSLHTSNRVGGPARVFASKRCCISSGDPTQAKRGRPLDVRATNITDHQAPQSGLNSRNRPGQRSSIKGGGARLAPRVEAVEPVNGTH